MLQKIKDFIAKLQDQGVPIFFIKDPQTKLPSVSLTLLVVAFTLTIISLLNKFAKIFEGVDVDNTLELLIITSSLYFGRAFSKKMSQNNQDEDKKDK